MKRARKKRDRKKIDYWQSYSDMMAALLLVFILIVFATIQKLQSQQDDLISKQQMIEKQRITIKQLGGDSGYDAQKLQEMEEKVSKIIGVKAEIIEDLRKELKNVDLEIDGQTGAIQFNSEILFDKNKSILKSSGKKELDKFMKGYFKVLLNDKFRDNIAEIIVEGHTDTDGSYNYNLELSQKRALSVSNYCLNSKELDLTAKQKDQLRKIITANGRSYSNPIKRKDGSVDKEKSRRVVFQFRLKDDEMIQQLQEILESE
ncbi:MAG: OmpA family protein [Lachnospiraceae bacterium]|nr:OmpA family protein [Lachnospiraceae bacterium]